MRIAVTVVAALGGLLLPGAATHAGCHCLPAADVAPVWSPDDTKIAYTELLGPTHVATVAGGNDAALSGSTANLVLSPDWKAAAAIVNDNARGYLLVLVSPAGTLTELDSAFPTPPVWSPDNQRLAYVGADQGLYVIRADGSNRHIVAAHVNPYSPPAWSPDGAHLAYAVEKDIFVDGRDLTATIPGNHVNPTWSPRGDAVAFSTDFGMKIGIVGLDGARRLDVDSQLPVASTQLALSWSPAADALVYSHHANSVPESSAVVRIDLATGTQLALSPFGVDAAYSHDGRTIAFGGSTNIQSDEASERDCVGVGIWTIPAEGGAPSLVTTTCNSTPATLSIHAPRSVSFGVRTDLSGGVLPSYGPVVDLEVHACGRAAEPQVAVAESGYWSLSAYPRVTTEYVATAGGSSVTTRVAVMPVVLLKAVGKLRYEAQVTAGRSFAGTLLHVELVQLNGRSKLLRRVNVGTRNRVRFTLSARQLHVYLESLYVAAPPTRCLAAATSNILAVSRP